MYTTFEDEFCSSDDINNSLLCFFFKTYETLVGRIKMETKIPMKYA